MKFIWKGPIPKPPFRVKKPSKRDGISLSFFESMDKFARKWFQNLIPVYRGDDTPSEKEYDDSMKAYREWRNSLFENKL